MIHFSVWTILNLNVSIFCIMFSFSVYMFNCSLNIRRLDITITISYGSTGTSFTYNSGMEGEIVGS